jgi:succinoglycan biosynthesis protein ExoA
MGSESEAFVSIAMPALNEEHYVAQAIASVLPRSSEIDYELLVVDGGSTDRTCAIVREMAACNPRIRLISNNRRVQAAAVNLAAAMANPRARYFVRADCHARYPDGFVERCIKHLAAGRGRSVVVPMRAEGATCLQRAIAAAQNSRLGNGGSAHRLPGRSGFVDHGHHAAFDLATFRQLGGYDETFSHNEDAEFDLRLARSGHRVYLDGDLAVTYFPRKDLVSLARQYFSHGFGRAKTLLKHGARPRVRQVLPVAVLAGILVSTAFTILDTRALAVPLAYVSIAVLWGVGLAIWERDLCVLMSGPAAVVMHISWGLGFLARVFLFRKQRWP